MLCWKNQIDITPTSFSTSTVSTMTIASHGQPSRKHPSGPLLTHFLQPMQRIGSTWIRPKGGLSSSGTQNMQSSTGQYSTHAGEPAQPVQHSVMTASSLGFFFRGVARPFDLGSNFSSSGTIPTALVAPGAAGMRGIIAQYRMGIVELILTGPLQFTPKMEREARPKQRSTPYPPGLFCYIEPMKTRSYAYGWEKSEPRPIDWQSGQGSRDQVHAPRDARGENYHRHQRA